MDGSACRLGVGVLALALASACTPAEDGGIPQPTDEGAASEGESDDEAGTDTATDTGTTTETDTSSSSDGSGETGEEGSEDSGEETGPLAGDCDHAPPPGWTQVWCDDFAETIDPANWSFEVDGLGGGNNELQYYTDRPENARVEDGALVIEALEEQYTGPDGTRDYTSARLRTFQLAQWTYGRVEARIRLPKGQGLWPAFWMLPTDWVYGGWAASGEIDIMELIGHEPETVYGTLHYGGEWPTNTSSASVPPDFGSHGYSLESGDFSEDFHVFAIEWEETQIRWYVDGQHVQTQSQWWSEAADYPAPYDQDFHLLLNVAVGGTWPGSPDETTVFPQRMTVDWVRVYEAG